MQDLYRLTAQHDSRRKRELIAAECVRLGRITTIRTPATKWGEAQVVDVWEEGYATKDLRVKESALFRRKSALEARKVELSKRKSALTRTSNKLLKSGSDIALNLELMDNAQNSALEMDIYIEQETLKYHADQIKMYSD